MVKPLLALLSAMVLFAGCSTAAFDRPCPRISDFPKEVQIQAATEMRAEPPKPALQRILDAVFADREFNRRICP